MSFGPTDLDIYAHLRGMLDAFQKRALEYSSSPKDEQVRLHRVNEIEAFLTGNGVLPDAVNLGECPNCQPGEHCEGGACVPDTVFSGIPADDGPASSKRKKLGEKRSK